MACAHWGSLLLLYRSGELAVLSLFIKEVIIFERDAGKLEQGKKKKEPHSGLSAQPMIDLAMAPVLLEEKACT